MTRHSLLWGVLILQTLCVAFFIADTAIELLGWDDTGLLIDSDRLEYAVTLALVLGIAVTWTEIRRLTTRDRDLSRQVELATGAFGSVLERHLDAWGLTAAERDVAVLAIKGFSIAEIADIRQTKLGTIKAQCGSVYRKAGVSGRLQLLSLFIEDLMADELIERAAHRQP